MSVLLYNDIFFQNSGETAGSALKHNKQMALFYSSRMNIILDIESFYLGYIYFLETKRNIIIDGVFTKIIYSSDIFSMSGVYLTFPVMFQTVEKGMSNKYLRMYNCFPGNIQLVHDFSKLEFKIIEHYKQMRGCTKKPSYLLAKQLYSGNLKIYKEHNQYENEMSPSIDQPEYYVKISGIWETKDELGITYKIIEVGT